MIILPRTTYVLLAGNVLSHAHSISARRTAPLVCGPRFKLNLRVCYVLKNYNFFVRIILIVDYIHSSCTLQPSSNGWCTLKRHRRISSEQWIRLLELSGECPSPSRGMMMISPTDSTIALLPPSAWFSPLLLAPSNMWVSVLNVESI